jgi:signal transduction histidine kinase
MLSHELRNPLNALSTAAHLLAISDPAGEDAAAARGIIERQTRRMGRLVGDLLDMSRLTMGKLLLQQESFDLAGTLTGIVSTWRASGRLGAHDVRLDVESAPVHADPTRIEQIVDNLLDNAVKFTPAGCGITISLKREAGSAVLRVSDEGIGLSPEECGRVFELFAQGETSARRGGGLGIGLALVRHLVEAHGGSVHASSGGTGKGATFEVRLPLAARKAQ